MMERAAQFFSWAAGAVSRRLQTVSIHQALRKHGLSSHRRIHTFTTGEELQQLFALARACRTDGRALEIGSYLGASTCYIVAGMRGPNATVTCVDTWTNDNMPDGVRDTLPEFENNLRPALRQIRVVRRSSGDLTPGDLGGPFDLVFLDGDHSYDRTRSDFCLVSGLVADDGVVVFHDSKYWEGVSRVVGDALASGEWQLGGNLMNMCWLVRARFPHDASVGGD